MSSCGGPNTLFGYLYLSRSCYAGSPTAALRDYATRQVNAFLWVSLIAVTVILLRKVNKLLRLWAKGCLIPGPPCSSFYGHSKLISGANLTDVLKRSHDKYGPVVKLWLGPAQLLVSIKDPELIREMLLKAEDKLPLTGRAFHLAFGPSSLFVSSFDEVKKSRDILATELSGKLLERANIVSTKVVDSLMKKIPGFKAKETLDCKTVSQYLAFTTLGATLFGDEFLGWSKATIYGELLMMIAKDACFWASYGVIPFWKQGFWRYQYLCTKLRSLTQDIIQECRKNYKLLCQKSQISQNESIGAGPGAASGATKSSSFTLSNNWFLWERDGHINSGEEPYGNIGSVMFHGCLTTAGLIGNILARLATNPEIQDKVYSEIVNVRKSVWAQQQHGVDKMPLLLATVYESARLLPAGPFLQRCSLKHDINLTTGVTIPAGAILVVPVQLVQTDDSCWGSDASQFNPHRFLSKAKNNPDLIHVASFPEELEDVGQYSCILNDPNENAAFLPFGSGTRACLGQKFAILGVATLFASLLEHYEIRLQAGSQNDPRPTINDCVLELLPSPEIVFVQRAS